MGKGQSGRGKGIVRPKPRSSWGDFMAGRRDDQWEKKAAREALKHKCDGFTILPMESTAHVHVSHRKTHWHPFYLKSLLHKQILISEDQYCDSGRWRLQKLMQKSCGTSLDLARVTSLGRSEGVWGWDRKAYLFPSTRTPASDSNGQEGLVLRTCYSTGVVVSHENFMKH